MPFVTNFSRPAARTGAAGSTLRSSACSGLSLDSLLSCLFFPFSGRLKMTTRSLAVAQARMNHHHHTTRWTKIRSSPNRPPSPLPLRLQAGLEALLLGSDSLRSRVPCLDRVGAANSSVCGVLGMAHWIVTDIMGCTIRCIRTMVDRTSQVPRERTRRRALAELATVRCVRTVMDSCSHSRSPHYTKPPQSAQASSPPTTCSRH